MVAGLGMVGAVVADGGTCFELLWSVYLLCRNKFIRFVVLDVNLPRSLNLCEYRQ